MSTYLQLCQEAAKESGVFSGTVPTAVTGQTGGLLKLVGHVAAAWTAIQNDSNAWLWMAAEFSKSATSGTARYTPAAWSLDRHARWHTDNRVTGYRPHTIYKTATGVSDENELQQISFELWRTQYGRGSQTNNRPTVYAISPAGEFCLGPIPDDTYTINGTYQKSAQVLAADGDTPECPARFHRVISMRALMMFNGQDEAPEAYAWARSEYRSLYPQLRRDQLPQIAIGSGPIA